MTIPLVVVGNVVNGTLSGLAGLAQNLANSTSRPIGQAQATPTPLQIPLPFLQLPVGKTDKDEENGAEVFKEDENGNGGAEVFFKPLLAPLQALFKVTAKDEEEDEVEVFEEKNNDVEVF